MKIAVDSMGGDYAPSSIIRGTIAALNERKGQFQIILTGYQDEIRRELKENNFTSPDLEILHTTQSVEMTDKPSQVLKMKPDSSLVSGIRLVQEEIASAFVSAGSTGAILSTALFLLGRIKGVRRPALGVYFPVEPRGLVLCDVGANIEIKPIHLLQFAIMASEYVKHIQDVDNPRVGLLNIGVEPTKGKEVYIQTYNLLSKSLSNFHGNIESRYLMDGLVDVVVCDGFVGNHLVKFAEGLFGHIRNEVFQQLKQRLTAETQLNAIDEIFSQVFQEYEYEKYGGVPLLGVNGVCIVCHGNSREKSIKNAIFAAQKSVEERLVSSIKKGISTTVSQLSYTFKT